LALRGDAEEHRRVTPLAAVAAASLVAPLVLAAVGADYVLARNLLPVWLPIAILVAAGMTVHHAGKLGVAAAAALCVFFAAVSVAVPLVAKLRRESITAQLLNVPGQKATVDIAFARVPAGGRRALSVRCPGGYRAQRALVGWLGDAPRGARLMSRRGRPALTSWMATGVASPDRAATYQLAVICGPAAG
jgi:hypothetical protein